MNLIQNESFDNIVSIFDTVSNFGPGVFWKVREASK